MIDEIVDNLIKLLTIVALLLEIARQLDERDHLQHGRNYFRPLYEV